MECSLEGTKKFLYKLMGSCAYLRKQTAFTVVMLVSIGNQLESLCTNFNMIKTFTAQIVLIFTLSLMLTSYFPQI